MDAFVSLRQVLPQSQFVGGDDVQVSRIVSDPGECSPGDLLAILADCEDPTEAGCQALARGAAGLLTEQLLPVPLTQCIVRDADRAAAMLCDELFDRPAEQLLMIGIVGGDGKTTTSLLVTNVLRGEGVRTAFETDLGRSDGVVQTTASTRPRTIAATCEFLADARDAGAAAVVMELSDATVHNDAFDHLSFDVLILTGGGKKYRETGLECEGFGPTLEDLALQRLRDGGAAIVNGDCPLAMAAADRAGVPMLSYAMRNDADVEGKIFEQQPGETTVMVTAGETTVVMESALTGPAMASCQMAAVATGLLMEIPLHKAVQLASAVRTVPGRMQRIVEYGKPTVVLDLCGSSQRLAAVLRGLRRERNGGRLWVVAAGDVEILGQELAAMGRTAERYADKTVVTINPEQKGDFLRLAHHWLDGVECPATPRLIADRATAIAWVLGQAAAEDTVLIAGGWPTQSPSGQRLAITLDEQLVAESLAARDHDAAQDTESEMLIFPFSSAK